MSRIDIDRSDHNRFNTGLNDLFRASASVAERGTRFERQVQRRLGRRNIAEVPEAFHLRVWAARFSMMSPRDNLVAGNEHGSDSGVRARPSKTFARFS